MSSLWFMRFPIHVISLVHKITYTCHLSGTWDFLYMSSLWFMRFPIHAISLVHEISYTCHLSGSWGFLYMSSLWFMRFPIHVISLVHEISYTCHLSGSWDFLYMPSLWFMRFPIHVISLVHEVWTSLHSFKPPPTQTLTSYMFVANVPLSIIVAIFSSPEHEVLMVSYCGQWLSVVRRRASSVVRRPSSVNIWCLHSRDHICDLILMKLDQNVCFNNI